MNPRTQTQNPRPLNSDMAHLLPVEQLISHEERERDRRSAKLVLLVFAVSGWVFFALGLVVVGCR